MSGCSFTNKILSIQSILIIDNVNIFSNEDIDNKAYNQSDSASQQTSLQVGPSSLSFLFVN